MFRHRPGRPAPFSDFINWTDYRWEPSTWQGAASKARPWGAHRPQRRGYTFLQVLVAGLAVVAGVKLMSALRNRGNRSFIERAVLAVLLMMVASYVSRRRQPRTW